MVDKVKLLDRRLLTRRCVACGYDGALLRAGRAPRCARCGCDLAERPARSYAEMEGLLGQPITIDAPMTRARREQRQVQRWVMFLFVAMLGLIALGWLSSAAFAA